MTNGPHSMSALCTCFDIIIYSNDWQRVMEQVREIMNR